MLDFILKTLVGKKVDELTGNPLIFGLLQVQLPKVAALIKTISASGYGDKTVGQLLDDGTSLGAILQSDGAQQLFADFMSSREDFELAKKMRSEGFITSCPHCGMPTSHSL